MIRTWSFLSLWTQSLPIYNTYILRPLQLVPALQ